MKYNTFQHQIDTARSTLFDMAFLFSIHPLDVIVFVAQDRSPEEYHTVVETTSTEQE